jgi:hypothetical protein
MELYNLEIFYSENYAKIIIIIPQLLKNEGLTL